MRKLVINGSIIIFSIMLIFHTLVFFQIIPMEMVWGGRIESVSELRKMEGISLIVTVALLVFSLGIKKKLPIKIPNIAQKMIFVFLIILFSLNTVGNLLSNTNLEKIIFTPLTILLVVFYIVLLLSDKSGK